MIEEKKNYQKTVGWILLIPPLLSVLFFILSIFGVRWRVSQLKNLSSEWTTYVDYNYSSEAGGGGGGGASSAPIYLGLMAIAGALLIKEK